MVSEPSLKKRFSSPHGVMITKTKDDTNNEMAAITGDSDRKESQTTKGLLLMSDLNPYMLLSSDTPGVLPIQVKLTKNNTINGQPHS